MMRKLTAALLGSVLLSTVLVPDAVAAPVPLRTRAIPAVAAPKITIKNFGYTGDLTVQPGQRVTVVNADSVEHTLTDKKTHLFDTGPIAANGGKAHFTAPGKAGRYPFGCNFHPDMAGTLIVKAPAHASSLTAPASATIRSGATRRLTATLRDRVTGRAIGSAAVTMYARTGAHVFAVLHHLTTSSTGSVSANVRPHVRTQYRWRFAGSSGHETVTSAITTISIKK
jgi:plastocyanin